MESIKEEKRMERYRFDKYTRAALENSIVPIGVYQIVDGQVVTLIASAVTFSLLKPLYLL